MSSHRIRRIREVDRAFVEGLLGAVSTRAHDLPGYVILRESQTVGLVVYSVTDQGCEIVLLYTAVERIGLGSTLLREVRKAARRSRSHRVWVAIGESEDRLRRFYERNGYRARETAEGERVLELPLGTRAADTTAL